MMTHTHYARFTYGVLLALCLGCGHGPALAQEKIKQEQVKQSQPVAIAPGKPSSSPPGGNTEFAPECGATNKALEGSSSIPAPSAFPNAGQAGSRRADCLVTVDAILGPWKADKITLVDVRDPRAFDEFHIPRSINLPAYAIKAKAFLKAKPVVIVNEGRTHGELMQACDQLKRRGFRQVSVLQGGLNAWRDRMAPLAGSRAAQARLNQISPLEFMAAQQERRWIVIDASGGNQLTDQLFAEQGVIPYRANERAFMAALNTELQRTKQGVPHGTLVVTRDGDGYAPIEQVLQRHGLHNVFYLEGGSGAYQLDLATRRAQLARLHVEPQESKRCGG